MTPAPRILIAAGGTGGHLFPALAMADAIKRLKPDVCVVFVGTKKRIESRVVPSAKGGGFEFHTIWVSGFDRRLKLSTVVFPLKVVVSLVQSFFLIRRMRPQVVVGTGGYVSGPVLFMASLMGIPTVIHESNSYPGVTTRLLARKVDHVLIAFDATKRWLSRTDNVELLGTPTRAEFGSPDLSGQREGRAAFGLDPDKPTVLVVGGSLGAASINSAILSMLDELLAQRVQFVWQTGEGDFERVQQAVGERRVGWVGPFIDAMERAYAAADVVVCRSGALTLAELTVVGKPAILVPYPHAAADHQTLNARMMVEAGAAVMIRDAELSTGLHEKLFSLLHDDERRRAMAAASKALGRPEATRMIAEKILSLVA